MPSVRVRNRGYSVVSDVRRAAVQGDAVNQSPLPSLLARPLRHIRRSLPSFSTVQPGLQHGEEPHSLQTLEPSVGAASANYQGPSVSSPVGPERAPGPPSPAEPSITLFGPKPTTRRRSSTHNGPDSESKIIAALGVQSKDDRLHDDVVEHLDAVDPQVAVASSVNCIANSIVIPPVPFINRTPTVNLATVPLAPAPSRSIKEQQDIDRLSRHTNELDCHVASVLLRESSLKRSMHGIWAFLKTPKPMVYDVGAYMHVLVHALGQVFALLYGFLCAFWGAAIFLFLTRIINLHNPNQQNLWIEICSQIENGLFTLTGVGLIPWRILDTYRVLRILQFKRLVQERRKQRGLPPPNDRNELPDALDDPDGDGVLTAEEMTSLGSYQTKFSRSQTWYRPHSTDTHTAFPITTSLWICLAIDGNSVFQCLLCGCMWGLNRHNRPPWTTGSLIPLSFLCGVAAAVMIWQGGKKTRKTEHVTRRLRAALVDETTPLQVAAQAPGVHEDGSAEKHERGESSGHDSGASDPRSRPRQAAHPLTIAHTEVANG